VADLPEWVQELNLSGRIKYDERGPAIRLQGSDQDAAAGAHALADVLDLASDYMPDGYRISLVRGHTEHKRGLRFSWFVTWITDAEAERRYQEKQAKQAKQAKRMSRYEVQT